MVENFTLKNNHIHLEKQAKSNLHLGSSLLKVWVCKLKCLEWQSLLENLVKTDRHHPLRTSCKTLERCLWNFRVLNSRPTRCCECRSKWRDIFTALKLLLFQSTSPASGCWNQKLHAMHALLAARTHRRERKQLIKGKEKTHVVICQIYLST